MTEKENKQNRKGGNENQRGREDLLRTWLPPLAEEFLKIFPTQVSNRAKNMKLVTSTYRKLFNFCAEAESLLSLQQTRRK